VAEQFIGSVDEINIHAAPIVFCRRW